MKKTLMALAVLATAGLASAQSSVTLFGVVDATLQRVSNSGAGAGSVTRLTSGGYNSSRLGFRGTEDLGGGMSASFWLEMGMSNDDGQGQATNVNNQASGTGAGVAGRQGLTFNRRSTVSLAGGWGELRLGRDYTPQFWNLVVFDPFGVVGAGATQTFSGIITGATSTRASNSIGYFLPGNLGGFYGQAQYYMGENGSLSGTPVGATSDDGNGMGLRLGYAAGPFNVALGLSRTKYAAGDVKQNNLGGSWDFGVAKLLAHISRDSVGTVDADGWLIGGLLPVGAGEVRLAFSQYEVTAAGPDPKSRKVSLGYVHNLSKRTALYTTYARVRNSNGAVASAAPGAVAGPAASRNSTGYDFGVRHSF